MFDHEIFFKNARISEMELFISDAEVALSQPEYQYLPVQKAELESLIRIAKRSLRERKNVG